MSLACARSWLLWVPLGFALAVGSCGQPDGRQPVSGRVTYDGRPLVYGLIHFDPDTSKGHRGPQGAGEIHDGAYCTNPDYGAVPGPHLVRITGWMSYPDRGMLGPAVVRDYERHVEVPAAAAKLDFDIPALSPQRK